MHVEWRCRILISPKRSLHYRDRNDQLNIDQLAWQLTKNKHYSKQVSPVENNTKERLGKTDAQNWREPQNSWTSICIPSDLAS